MRSKARRAGVMLAVAAIASTMLPALVSDPAGAATPPPTACAGACWVPPANTSWQIQLQGKIKTTFDVRLYDIDLFDAPPATIAALHAAGHKVACYFSAGSYENWRSDAGRFPAAVKGLGNGWPGEQWLDVRRVDLLMPIMTARLDLCRQKGFDSVDADNMDGYTNTTGFPLTAGDQLAYNATIANAAHARGLTIALKNDLEQIPQLVSYFDWAVNEQCFQYQECGLLAPFRSAGKAVMNIEYKLGLKKFCPAANALNFNSLKKALSLKAARKACR
ncbi:MAG: endo alpha-1,4 polygalactosaminidase [Acidimicrobiia bacterium]